MFVTELEMSRKFESFLKQNFGTAYLKEQEGLFGIPDFVWYAKQEEDIAIVSFELKLRNWKRAAIQAFRYKSFSNASYVVIADETAHVAAENIEMFKKYNIGLASFDKNGEFLILFKPEAGIPYCGNLNQKIVHKVSSSKKKAKNAQVLLS